eukprot:2047841-Amphidinium_carterae.1
MATMPWKERGRGPGRLYWCMHAMCESFAILWRSWSSRRPMIRSGMLLSDRWWTKGTCMAFFA